MKNIILIGASGVAHQIIDTIYDINQRKAVWKIIGIIDDDPQKTGRGFYRGTQIIGTTAVIEEFDLQHTWFLLAFSSPQYFMLRKSYLKSLLTTHHQVRFASIIHPSVYVSPTAEVGKGVFLGAGTCVDANAKIGDHVIVLFNSVISRFVSIGDYTFISTSVNITGNQTIGENSYIGVNTTINADVGKKVLLNAATVVRKPVPDNSIVSGRTSQNAITCESAEKLQMMLKRTFAMVRK